MIRYGTYLMEYNKLYIYIYKKRDSFLINTHFSLYFVQITFKMYIILYDYLCNVCYFYSICMRLYVCYFI